MTTLLEVLGQVFRWMWQASWQGSVAIALILAVHTLLGKRMVPRWRYALWFLVLARLVLPASFESRVSVFNWVGRQQLPVFTTGTSDTGTSLPKAEEGPAAQPPQSRSIPLRLWLPALWLAGVILLPCVLAGNGLFMWRKIRVERQVTDGEVMALLEDCKQEMGVRTPIAVVETSAVATPSLFGFVRPRVLLPKGLLRTFSPAELRYVFLHELAHIKRGDIAANWFATVVLVLHWFNPLVWLAFSRMRADRELACDALALSRARDTDPRPYGETIIKLVEGFSRPALVPSMAGILENGNQIKRRISMIANFRRNSGWPFGVAAAVLVALLTLTDARSGQGGPAPQGESGGPPQIVSSSPSPGDVDVKPSVTEIIVTFDRDMAEGFSWTGGGPEFPPSPEGKKAFWKDKRTCVLPVTLQAARYYRVGINSTSFQNFKSAEGTAARPSAIYFTTEGASDALKKRAQKPMIVKIEPKNNAQDVDPGLKELRVTFNVPMGGGFSWTGGGENFPTIPEGKKPYWSEDKKTCFLPVELKSNWTYQLGLNSPSHKNFQSAGGVPLDPVSYSFKTK